MPTSQENGILLNRTSVINGSFTEFLSNQFIAFMFIAFLINLSNYHGIMGSIYLIYLFFRLIYIFGSRKLKTLSL